MAVKRFRFEVNSRYEENRQPLNNGNQAELKANPFRDSIQGEFSGIFAPSLLSSGKVTGCNQVEVGGLG